MATKLERQESSAGDVEDLEQGMRSTNGTNGGARPQAPLSDRMRVHTGGAQQPCRPLPATQECAGSKSVESFISRHYNPGSDVVLRWEFIHDSETKRVLIGLWVVEAVGLVFLFTGIALKTHRGQRWFFRTHFQEAANVACGIVCWLALMTCGYFFARRLIQQRSSGKRWSMRRKRTAWRAGLDHIFITINVTSYLASNLYVVAGGCRWFSHFAIAMGSLQWSCWNATFALFLMHAHDTNHWDCTSGESGGLDLHDPHLLAT